LDRIALPLVQALLRFEREGFAPLAAAYRQRDLLLGQPVHTTGPQALQGVCEGVSSDGALLLRCAGVIQRVVSGEVSVRWQPEAAG
jgi:BirA family biotin operon repressor/biotin-[acetyl-CoA-carboxylase] ligase